MHLYTKKHIDNISFKALLMIPEVVLIKYTDEEIEKLKM